MKERIAVMSGIPVYCFNDMHADDMGPFLDIMQQLVDEGDREAIARVRAFARSLDSDCSEYMQGPPCNSAG